MHTKIIQGLKKGMGALMLGAGPDPTPGGQARHQSRAHQTAGVWVVVNHPEMSLFRGLNEAPTTKGGPACGRTACPPASDTHNSFIQEPHVHTKAQKSIRHPATLDNAPNLLRIEGSNEGTALGVGGSNWHTKKLKTHMTLLGRKG